MKPIDLLDKIRNAGLNLSLLPGDLLKVTPAEKITDEIRGMILQHKNELVGLLSYNREPNRKSGDRLQDEPTDGAPAPGPETCRGCERLEVIKVGGECIAGCVRQLVSGSWREEWHRLPADLKRCIINSL
jgi:hypothetical protein